jgi:hypothetical protein
MVAGAVFAGIPRAFDGHISAWICNVIFLTFLTVSFCLFRLKNDASIHLFRITIAFIAISLVMFVISVLFITYAPQMDQRLPFITATLAFPVENLGYYPAGSDVPLPFGSVIWGASLLTLVLTADGLGQVAAHVGPPKG